MKMVEYDFSLCSFSEKQHEYFTSYINSFEFAQLQWLFEWIFEEKKVKALLNI